MFESSQRAPTLIDKNWPLSLEANWRLAIPMDFVSSPVIEVCSLVVWCCDPLDARRLRLWGWTIHIWGKNGIRRGKGRKVLCRMDLRQWRLQKRYVNIGSCSEKWMLIKVSWDNGRSAGDERRGKLSGRMINNKTIVIAYLEYVERALKGAQLAKLWLSLLWWRKLEYFLALWEEEKAASWRKVGGL